VVEGNWGFVGDGILAGGSRIRLRFEARLRPQGTLSGDDSRDAVIAQVENIFVRDTSQPFSAVRFSGQAAGRAIPSQAGDQLVYRATVIEGDPSTMYILNGDGKRTGGSIPRLDLPTATTAAR
jgi:hypothetical protein